MADINYSSGPGGYSLSTPGSPGVGGGGYVPGSNQDLINFYREMARRKMMSQSPAMGMRMAPDPEPAYAAPGRDSGPAPRARVETPWYTAQGAATRPVGLGAQMIPGMGIDPHLLPPEMRPDSAGVSYAPSVVAGAKVNLGRETDFDEQMAEDRARTRGQMGEVGGAAPGTPGGAVPRGVSLPQGTAPMLTPSNATVPGRPMGMVDPYERIRRAGLNAGYGR